MGTKTGHVMTLSNGIIGVGILAMPFCFQKCGILLSIVLLIASNLLTRICCHFLLKSSILCRRKTIEIMAFHIFGSSGKLMVELCIIGYLMGACITYFVVVGDLGPQIVAKMFDLNQTDILRTWVLVVVTLLCIIPLGLLRNIDSLLVVSTAAVGFYFCLIVKIIEESQTNLSSGVWMDNVEYWKASGILQCLPIFSMALSCQMQLFEVYDSVPGVSLSKMNAIIKSATNLCTGVYILVGFFGYVAFSNQQFSGNILLNLTPSIVSDAIKIGFVLSVAFSFPLVLFPCRASLYSLLYRRGHSDVAHYIPEHRFKWMTVSMIILAMVIGILIPSVELVIGLVGSTIGVAICIMFPASCFIKVSKKESAEKLIAQSLLVIGFVVMILGTYANLTAIDENQSGPDAGPSDKLENILKNINVLNESPPSTNNLINLTVDKLYTKQSDIEVKEINLEKIDINPDNMAQVNVNIIPLPEKVAAVSIEPIIVAKKDVDINREAIQREDREIAMEQSQQNVQINNEIKQQVAEIKNEIEKQNQETQKLVLQKFEEIVDKVEKIEKIQEEEIEKHSKADEVAASADGVQSNVLNDKIPEVIKPLPEKQLNPIISLLINNQLVKNESLDILKLNESKADDVHPKQLVNLLDNNVQPKVEINNKSVIESVNNSQIVQPNVESLVYKEKIENVQETNANLKLNENYVNNVQESIGKNTNNQINDPVQNNSKVNDQILNANDEKIQQNEAIQNDIQAIRRDLLDIIEGQPKNADDTINREKRSAEYCEKNGQQKVGKIAVGYEQNNLLLPSENTILDLSNIGGDLKTIENIEFIKTKI